MSKSSVNLGRRGILFEPRTTRKATKFFIEVAALTEGIALAKFLCAKVGFTQLRRRRYGAPAARRHEADFLSITEKSKGALKRGRYPAASCKIRFFDYVNSFADAV